jgi:hypothetical protein
LVPEDATLLFEEQRLMKRSLFLSVAAGLVASLAFGTPSHAGSLTYSVSGGDTVSATSIGNGGATATVHDAASGSVTPPANVTIATYSIAATGNGFTFTPPNNFTFNGGQFMGESDTLAVVLTPTGGASKTVDVTVSFTGFAWAGNTSGVAVSAIATPTVVSVGGENYSIIATTDSTAKGVIIELGFVPEPSTMSLLGIGMASFFAYRRLFKRRPAAA